MSKKFATPPWVRSLICVVGCLVVVLLAVRVVFGDVHPLAAGGILSFGAMTARLGFKTFP